jgi:hypothetical protein
MPDGTPVAIETTEVSDVTTSIDPDALVVFLRNGRRYHIKGSLTEIIEKLRVNA